MYQSVTMHQSVGTYDYLTICWICRTGRRVIPDLPNRVYLFGFCHQHPAWPRAVESYQIWFRQFRRSKVYIYNKLLSAVLIINYFQPSSKSSSWLCDRFCAKQWRYSTTCMKVIIKRGLPTILELHVIFSIYCNILKFSVFTPTILWS